MVVAQMMKGPLKILMEGDSSESVDGEVLKGMSFILCVDYTHVPISLEIMFILK